MDMKKMMKQAQKMQLEAARAQEEIAQMEFTATTGGGMVKVVAMGDMSVKSVSIDPAAVDPEDVEMLEDMILAATNEAPLRDRGLERAHDLAHGGHEDSRPHVGRRAPG